MIQRRRTALKKGFGKISFFKKSGARLYIPQKLIKDSKFPFKDGEIVKITIKDNSLIVKSVEWWEMIDWDSIPEVFEKLPEEIKQKIKLSSSS
ncbi:hypothetical protein DRP04_12095 [Archaeoglobales archaeon]|nr:MAG: hypothetical protein DRP04_12095 [Archaeoglobales archaeon]